MFAGCCASGQPAALLNLVDALLDDATLDVSPDRVWISGLSSGAADATYLELFNQYGISDRFMLYESEVGDWYEDPDSVPPRGCP